MTSAYVTRGRPQSARGAKSTGCLVALFLLVIVVRGMPAMLIVPLSMSVLPGGLELLQCGDVAISGAIGFGWLGLTWLAMAHLAKRDAICGMLQLGGVAAFLCAATLFVLQSDYRMFSAVSAAPFACAALVKPVWAARLIGSAVSADWQFSLRELLWFVLSWTAFLVPMLRVLSGI